MSATISPIRGYASVNSVVADPTNAARQARYRKRQRATGVRQTGVWVPRRWEGLLASLAQTLREHPDLPAIEFLVYWRDEKGRVHPLKELID